MINNAHEFDYLRNWNSMYDSEIKENITDESIAMMERIMDLLYDETNPERIEVTKENFVILVREMHKLCRVGSRKLGEAIIKASEYADNNEYEEALKTYEDFLSSCKSKFYRDIARGYIKELTNDME